MLLFNIAREEIEEDLHKIIIYDCKEFYNNVYESFSASRLDADAIIVMRRIGYKFEDRERFKKIAEKQIQSMPKCCFEGGNYVKIIDELNKISDYFSCWQFIKDHEDLIPYIFIGEEIIKKAYEFTINDLSEEADSLTFNEFRGIFKENLYDCIHSVAWRTKKEE